MKSKILLLSFLFLILSASLYASGKKDEAEVKTQNDEWILCITDFDKSSLSPERHIVAEVITKKLVEKLNPISYRARISGEYTYYEETAWAQDRSRAAKALAAKQNERSLLVFRGDPGWRYRQNLAKIDSDIENLRLALEEVENNPPLISTEPAFNLTSGNRNLVFPAPPIAGNENRFCLSQKADAFFQGSVTDFHGRFLISLKLYTLATQSYVWEDTIVFSHNDIEAALDEITRKLIIALSGSQSSIVTVTAENEDTLVLINRAFVGRGDTAAMEYPPGRITVTASAPNYESVTFETDLPAGEIVEIGISLTPVVYGNIEITTAGHVYHGALYIGEAPLTLRLPVNTLEYIELETSSTKGAVVFNTTGTPEFSSSLSVRTTTPPREGSVDGARRAFYWMWGSTWVTGIAAWLAYQSYNTSFAALNYKYNQDPTSDYQRLYDDTLMMYNVHVGTLIALGAVAVLDVIFIVRYLYLANKGSTPVRRIDRN